MILIKIFQIMLSAGFFENPKNANSIIHMIIQRSNKFEKIEPGVCRPIEKEKKTISLIIRIPNKIF